jgi:chromosome segregation ATPase
MMINGIFGRRSGRDLSGAVRSAEEITHDTDAPAETALEALKVKEPDQASPVCYRLSSAVSEFEKFSASFTRDIARFAALYGKLEADHTLLLRRHETLSTENQGAQSALSSLQSQTGSLQAEVLRLREANAALTRRLEKAQEDVQASREKAGFLQARCETLNGDLAVSTAACNERDINLIEARQELSSLSEVYEKARVQIEQGRQRESDLESRNLLLDVELQELRPGLDLALRQVAQHNDRVRMLESELQSMKAMVESRDSQIAELVSERDALAETCSALSVKLQESLSAADVKVDALAKTKVFLWSMSEKQRRQIADQISRISRLEASNSKLTQELLEASRVRQTAETKSGEQIPEAKQGGKRGSDSPLLN